MLKKKAKPQQAARAATPTKKAQRSPAPAQKTGRELGLIPATKAQKQLVKNQDWESMAGGGMERMTTADLVIPRLVVLQGLSPQVQKKHERYIEGAEPGDICDTITGTLFDGGEGILLIAVSWRHAYIEWIPRSKGGGFVMDHHDDSSILQKCTKTDDGNRVLANGNEIKEIHEYFIFVVEEDAVLKYVLSLGGAQLKKARRWNTLMHEWLLPTKNDPNVKKNPPIWYGVYRMTTVPERNDKGSWFSCEFKLEKPIDELPNGNTLFAEATEFNKSITSGRVAAASMAPDDADLGGGPVDTTTSEEIPY